MGREVRRVPANWEHPKYDNGKFVPLYGASYAERAARWDKENAKWNEGMRNDFKGGWKPLEEKYKGMSFTEWGGERPVADDYMPDWPEDRRTHLMMYENTSEGTPISPAFETPEELARWLVDNNASSFAGQTASYEGWLRVARGGFACSAVSNGGGPLNNGVDAF